jgi:hypothetical protein
VILHGSRKDGLILQGSREDDGLFLQGHRQDWEVWRGPCAEGDARPACSGFSRS